MRSARPDRRPSRRPGLRTCPRRALRYASAAAKDLLGYEPDQPGRHLDLRPLPPRRRRQARGGASQHARGRSLHRRLPVAPQGQRVRLGGDDEPRGRRATRKRRGEEFLCVTRLVERPASRRQAGERGIPVVVRAVSGACCDEEQIRPVYQPIFDLQTGRPIAYEALSRFPGDPARGPDRWFAEAWDVGLGVPLELMAVRIAGRGPAGAPGRRRPVRQCLAPDDLLGLLPRLPRRRRRPGHGRAHGAPPRRRLRGVQLQARVRCAAPGGKVAIDDFGAGYASLGTSSRSARSGSSSTSR